MLQYEERSQFICTATPALWHKHSVTLFFMHLSTMSSIYYQQGEWMELSTEVQLRPFFDHFFFNLKYIYNGTRERVLYKVEGRWDVWREAIIHFICSFLTWPLHNYFFYVPFNSHSQHNQGYGPSILSHTHTHTNWAHMTAPAAYL